MNDVPRFDRVAIERHVSESREAQPPAAAKPKTLTGKSLLAIAGGNAADAASTLYALQNGARETNPIYGTQPSAARIIGTKAASAVAEALLLKLLSKRHPDVANAMAKVIGGVNGAIAVHNVRQAHK